MEAFRKSFSPIRRAIPLALCAHLIAGSAAGAGEPGPLSLPPSIIEDGQRLEVITQWGTRAFGSELNLNTSNAYHIEIPLDALKPPDKAGAAAEPADDTQDDPDEKSDSRPEQSAKDQAPQKAPIDIDDSDELVLEANHLYNEAKYYEASEVVEELLQKKPGYVRGWVMKGSLMYVLGEKDLAKKAWQQALALEPNNGEVKYYLERYR